MDIIFNVIKGCSELLQRIFNTAENEVSKTKNTLVSQVMIVEEALWNIICRVYGAVIIWIIGWIKVWGIFLVLCYVAVFAATISAAGTLGSYYCLSPGATYLEHPFTFNYNTTNPVSMLPFRNEGRILSAPSFPFSSANTYKFDIVLTVPETPHNLQMGAITVSIDVYGLLSDDVQESLLSRMIHSGFMIPARSELVRQVSELILLPLHVLIGSTAPSQILIMPMTEIWKPFHNDNVTKMVVTLTPSLHVFSAKLRISAEAGGISWYFQYYPISCCLAIFAFLFGISFSGMSIVVLILLFAINMYLQSTPKVGWKSSVGNNEIKSVSNRFEQRQWSAEHEDIIRELIDKNNLLQLQVSRLQSAPSSDDGGGGVAIPDSDELQIYYTPPSTPPTTILLGSTSSSVRLRKRQAGGVGFE